MSLTINFSLIWYISRQPYSSYGYILLYFEETGLVTIWNQLVIIIRGMVAIAVSVVTSVAKTNQCHCHSLQCQSNRPRGPIIMNTQWVQIHCVSHIHVWSDALWYVMCLCRVEKSSGFSCAPGAVFIAQWDFTMLLGWHCSIRSPSLYQEYIKPLQRRIPSLPFPSLLPFFPPPCDSNFLIFLDPKYLSQIQVQSSWNFLENFLWVSHDD